MSDLITDYIESYEGMIKSKLIEIRNMIRQAVPEAIEKISYQMPAFYFNGVLVYFAAQKNHIGFYPTSDGIKAFEHKLSPYKHSKGAIQFPYTSSLPEELIKEIVLFRLRQNQEHKYLKI